MQKNHNNQRKQQIYQMSFTEFGKTQSSSVGIRPGMMNIMAAKAIQDGEPVKSDDDEDVKTIHSGHFMISRVHESSPDNDDEFEAPSIVHSPIPGGAFSFNDANTETCRTYRFGHRSTQTLAIDASLSKLFDCMTLAYSGKLTSPKWKQFRGMHVKVKDKIRLNNIIWREWVMQYIYGKRSVVCQFATPLSDRHMHTKPEAIVLEGYYWKRRLDTVTEEYKLWRKFFKDQHIKSNEVRMDFEDSGHEELLDRVQAVDSITMIPKQQHTSSTDLLLNSRDLQEMMDLSDSLISSLKSPFDFPIPKELSGFGYGDFIQPGLLPLQPNLDDFMDIDQLVNQELTNTARQMAGTGLSAIPGGRATLVKAAQSGVTVLPTGGAQGSSRDAQGPSNMVQESLSNTGFQMPMSPSTKPTPASRPTPSSPTSSLLECLQGSPSPKTETQMVVDPAIDSENFILNQLQLLQNEKRKQQQQQAHEKSLQQKLKHQQKLLQQEQQKKQQQQQQKQQQKQQEQIALLLQQNTQLKETLSTGNITVSALLEGLIKGGQLTVIPAATQAATAARETKAINVQHQDTKAIQLQPMEIKAIPEMAWEMKPIPVQPQEVRTLPTQGRTSAQRPIAKSKPSSVLTSQDVFTPQTSTTTSSVLQSFLSNRNSNTNASKATPVTNVKVANTSILSALNSGLAGNIGSPQKVLYQKPIQSQIPVQSMAKKDAFGFTVPSLPPKGRGKVHRTIAPSPPQPQSVPSATVTTSTAPSHSSQNSFLAQLLTTGTYPGAISVKQESEPIQNNAAVPSSGFTLQSISQSTDKTGLSSANFAIQPVSVQSGSRSAGTLHTLQAGNLQTGTLSAGNIQTGTLAAGNLPAGILQAGTQTANNYTIQSIPSQTGNQPLSSQVAPVNITAVLQSAGLSDFPTSVLLAAASHAFSPSLKEVLQSVSIQNAIPAVTPVNSCSPMKSVSPSPGPATFTMSPAGPTSPVMSPGSSSFDDSFKSLDESSIEMMTMDDEHSDTKRVSHISAEKKRRTNIKGGFEMLHTLIPSLSQNSSAKVSKAGMLLKTAEYCKKLKSERSQMQNEADILKQEINSLNNAISICQSQLPATGVPVTRQRADQMKEMFEEYVKQRTLSNWKFWIFSLIIRNLFDSYNNMVSTASVDDLCRTVLAWLDQHCSLVNLRPIAMNAMRHLSTTTSILSDPSRVPEQAAQAVIKRKKDSNTNKS